MAGLRYEGSTLVEIPLRDSLLEAADLIEDTESANREEPSAARTEAVRQLHHMADNLHKAASSVHIGGKISSSDPMRFIRDVREGNTVDFEFMGTDKDLEDVLTQMIGQLVMLFGIARHKNWLTGDKLDEFVVCFRQVVNIAEQSARRRQAKRALR